VTKETLTKFPGIHRRPDSGIYQFGLRAPKELLHHFPSGWAIRCSLKTADLRTANEQAKKLQAEWSARFEAMRTGKAIPVDLADVRTKLLNRLEQLLVEVDHQYQGLSFEERLERSDALAWQLADARSWVSGGGVPDWAADWMEELEFPRSALSDSEAMGHLLTVLEIRHEALTDHTRTFPKRVSEMSSRRRLLESMGVAAAGKSSTQLLAKGAAHKMSDALAVWLETEHPSKTIGTFTRHVNQFSEMMSNPALEVIDKPLAIEFRDSLQKWAVENNKTASTADNVLVSIRALTNVARDKGWITANPFERLSVKVGGRVLAKREPWLPQELKVLFDDPIWRDYKLPKDKKAGADAAYWIPLIACYTGARASEIAQLWTDDIAADHGVEVIEFRATETRNQSLKNEGSWRAVPMHTELIRLGLPEYVKSLPLGPLFPLLPVKGANGAGGQFGQWFGNFKRAKGFDSPTKTLHSFRHLVASELRLLSVAESLADAITGHTGESVARNVYSATIKRHAERLRSEINKLSYENLSLPRVWKAG
jgi:integrase